MKGSSLIDRRNEVETILSTKLDEPWMDFFNRPEFFAYHAKNSKGLYFQLLDKTTKHPLCVAHFTEKEPGLFISPLRGTYGGIDTREHDGALFEIFLEDIETMLKKENAKRIRLSLAPFAHDAERSVRLLNALYKRGFAMAKYDINYHLDVDDAPLLEKMEYNNQKRVKKCVREGCMFAHCGNFDEYKQVYDLIAINRKAKGYPLTMNWEQVKEMKELFPDTWQFFSTSLNGNMIASSVCIRINPKILYVFYWGDVPEAHALSPVAFHASNLYEHCQKEGVKILDIGTATDNGIPNTGLMTFKKRLGCRPSLKPVFEKVLL